MEGQLVTYSNAVLKSCKPEHKGLTNIYTLVFLAGAPSAVVPLPPLAFMDKRYTLNLYQVTGLTGGGETNLDGWATAGVSAGFTVDVNVTVGGNTGWRKFRLIDGDTTENLDPDAGALVIRPADYDAETNAKVWVE